MSRPAAAAAAGAVAVVAAAAAAGHSKGGLDTCVEDFGTAFQG